MWKELISQSVQLKERSVYTNKVRIICAPPSPSISPYNREYTVVPTILLESPQGPSDEKRLGPTNALIRPWFTHIGLLLVLLNAGIYKLRRKDGLKWEYDHAKIDKNRSKDSE
jgi:hypothetical protein